MQRKKGEDQELRRGFRKNTVNNEVFTLDEACEYLSISKSSMYKMNMEKVIPFYKPSRKVYYKKSDLDKYLSSNRMEADGDIDIQQFFYSK
jgi:excisionase family DNA binding protein